MNYLASVLMLACCAAAAQQAEEEMATPAVEVANFRDPVLKSYKTMLKGVDIYEQRKAMAPTAPLRFRLVPAPEAAPAALTLRIANDDTSVSVPVDADATFELPRLPDLAKDADLIVNARKGSVRWRPEIRTPGLPADERRLGDLRLECEVRWTIEKEELSFFRRNLFNAMGGPCVSSNINVRYVSGRKLASATLVKGEQQRSLPLALDGYAYVPPLHDKAWDNDAVVRLKYQE